jgi:hypothetical protein
VVEFDTEEKRVAVGDAAPQLDPYVRPDGVTDTVRTELAVAVVVGTQVTVGVLGVGPTSHVPVMWWAMLPVVALFGLGVWQLYH